MSKIAVFILSYERANKVKTYDCLIKQGFTGDIYIIVDDQDKQLQEYKRIYGEKVLTFEKSKYRGRFDMADNFKGTGTVVFARNACFDIAKSKGIRYFIQLDDDYTQFIYKFDVSLQFRERKICNLDRVFEIMLDYYKSINAKTIALAQNGDFIGGKHSSMSKHIKLIRKSMNSFFCDTDRVFEFKGRMNDDVNTYIDYGSRGELFFTIPLVSLIQTATQQNSGGLTDMYLAQGTYVKSFYSVMFQPSFVKIGLMGDKHKRLHHHISWNNAVPKILREVT